MKKPALAALASLLFCAAASAQTDGGWAKLEGQHSRIGEPLAIAVMDPAGWEKVWKDHDDSKPAPAVDFSKENVIAVFLGQTRNAGVKIEIVVQNDSIDENRLNVFYKEVRSASKPFTALPICRPYAMLKVRKTAVVSIERNARVGIPESAAAPRNVPDVSKVRALLETPPSFDGRR